MGADLILNVVPVCRLTPARRKKLLSLVPKLPAGELESVREALDLEDAAIGPEELVKQLKPHLDVLADGADRRDVTWLHLPGMDYQVLVTGGMSGGDYASEAAQSFQPFEWSESLFMQLLAWAREDWAAKQAVREHENRQREAAEREWASYQFEPDVVEEVNGWEDETPDHWQRIVFLRGDRESQACTFHVLFKPGTAEVIQVYAEMDGRAVGKRGTM